MNIFLDFFKTIGVSRLAAMGVVAVTIIGFFIYLIVKLSQPRMSVLFTDLPFEDSLAVAKKLEGMNLPHEIRQDGAVILVPKNKVLRLRMEFQPVDLSAMRYLTNLTVRVQLVLFRISSRLQEFIHAVREGLDQASKVGEFPVILTSPGIRPFVRSIVERFRSQTPVLSQNEIHPQMKLKTIAQI